VDQELLELVTMEIKETLAGTTLAEAPLAAVSAVTGEGLPELVRMIDQLLDATPPKRDIGRPRLPIDRVFTITGFGTVVTGTLVDGKLSVGQEVEIVPPRLRARIRGLQTHKKKLETVPPGSRVAANLSGLSTDELLRGNVLATPDWLRPTTMVDVKIRLLPALARPLRHNAEVSFHSNALEVVAKVRLLEKDELKPGETSWAQLAFAEPAAVVKGDLFIIRSTTETLGGGDIVDAYSKRHRRFQAATIQGLAAREKGSAEDMLLATLEAREPVEMAELTNRASLSPDEAQRAVEALLSQKRLVTLGDKGPHTLLFSAAGWQRLSGSVSQALAAFHRQFPLRSGMPKEELRSKIKASAGSFPAMLQLLVKDGILLEDLKTVHLPSHHVELNPKQKATVDAYLKSLSQNPYSPASDLVIDTELQDVLIDQRQVVKVSDNVVFAASAYNEMLDRIMSRLKSQGKITVAEVRDMFQTSRKYALALMEHLDERKVTRRVGDERVLR
jgi:selenocysteine-specific elongation factor